MFGWPLSIGIWKYWNFQSEATWRFIAIVTTHNVFSFKYSKWQRKFIPFDLNDSFIIFTTQEKYFTEENEIHKTTKLTLKKKIFVGFFCRKNWHLVAPMLGPNVTDNCLRKNFGMNKEDFFELPGLLEPIIKPEENSLNYRQLITEKKLAFTLYYLNDTGSLWITPNRFGVYQCTVSKRLPKVCKAINEILGPKYLYLPRNTEEIREMV